MSDRDGATPGRRRAPDPSDDPRVTRTPPPASHAAPWERGAGVGPPAAPRSGQHADDVGVTVADLIAKVGANPGRRRRRRAAENEAEPATRPGGDALDFPDDDDDAADDAARDTTTDTVVMAAVPAGYVSELPDLGRLAALASAAAPPTGSDLDDDLDDAAAGSGRRGPRPRVLVAGRAVAALVAVFALVLTGGAWQWQSVKNSSLNNVAALDPQSRDIVDPNAQYGDENFLIVGVDTRAGANSEIGAGDQSDAGGARSDTVMLVNIPANRQRVVAVSFPRDLQITPMKCEAWNPDTGEYGALYDETTGSWGPEEWFTETKLNSAYSYGGPKCLVKVIQKLSGLSINRFMAIDFAGFAKMVDAVGGVEVCSTTPIEDFELGTVLPTAGRQIVDGHTALNYVRARQVTTEVNGDYGRIKRQQLFLSSLMRSLISREVFFSLSKLNNVVNMFINDSYVDNIQTRDLVQLGQSIQGVSAGRMSFVTVPTSGEVDGMGNEVPRTDDIEALFSAIINDAPLPGEDTGRSTDPLAASAADDGTSAADVPATEAPTAAGPAELVTAVTTAPSDVTVHVSNSTGQSGLAATAAVELQQHGFNVTDPDDYPGSLPSTTVFFSSGNEPAAATVASAFGNAHVERVGGMGDTVQVVLGRDFSAVGAPTPSGSAVQVHISEGTTALPADLSVTNAADTRCE